MLISIEAKEVQAIIADYFGISKSNVYVTKDAGSGDLLFDITVSDIPTRKIHKLKALNEKQGK